jgi:protein tyrosine phosphatase (PTP) superfamily phosphohydrolase (DUF442 family)
LKKISIYLISVLFLYQSFALSAVREVKAGELYRSNQLSGNEIQNAVAKYGVKTLINLRGSHPSEKWWIEENAMAEKLNLNFVNISMSAKAIPSRDNLLALLDAFKSAPRPILVHCQAGVDRTGEAVAIYQITQWNLSKEQARKSIYPSLQQAKYYFIDEVFQGLDWSYVSYDPCKENYKYFDKSSCN